MLQHDFYQQKIVNRIFSMYNVLTYNVIVEILDCNTNFHVPMKVRRLYSDVLQLASYLKLYRAFRKTLLNMMIDFM